MYLHASQRTTVGKFEKQLDAVGKTTEVSIYSIFALLGRKAPFTHSTYTKSE